MSMDLKSAGSLLIEIPGDAELASEEFAGGPRRLGRAGLEAAIEAETSTWRVPLDSAVNPWDAAHRARDSQEILGVVAAVRFAEPDWMQAFPFERRGQAEGLESAGACAVKQPDSGWEPTDVPFAWHLSDDFSGLGSARARVGDRAEGVTVGILDTGYDPGHSTLPSGLDLDSARNFADPGNPYDARDPASNPDLESFIKNPGHGTATLAILAGTRVQPPEFSFDDFLGGCPHARIVPIRIADSVIHFSTSAMAEGIGYAAAIGCDVVSISMGGVPARSWAKAVNEAYERGTAIFAAAGNNVGGVPTRSLVYPARFHRVVAVCGATAGKEPYFKHILYPGMQGNFGPEGKMKTAVTAYTPNVTWAEIGCGKVISLDGAGTSSATPQAAAAAALWLAEHDPRPDEPWRRVEAARHALFSSADGSRSEFEKEFGNGLLRAHRALDVEPDLQRRKSPRDRVSFPWLRMLFGLETAAPVDDRQEMYELEALQLFLVSPEAQEIAAGADPDEGDLDAATTKRLLEKLAAHQDASTALRTLIRDQSGRL